jgi:hypothetical protein
VNLGGLPSFDVYSTTHPQARIDGLAAPAQRKIYWTEADYAANTFKIRRANLDGTQLEDIRNASDRAEKNSHATKSGPPARNLFNLHPAAVM